MLPSFILIGTYAFFLNGISINCIHVSLILKKSLSQAINKPTSMQLINWCEILEERRKDSSLLPFSYGQGSLVGIIEMG